MMEGKDAGRFYTSNGDACGEQRQSKRNSGPLHQRSDHRDTGQNRCPPGYSVKYDSSGSPTLPSQYIATVVCVHGMVPFKCMTVPLHEGRKKKKIKGYAVLFYYFYFIFRNSASESLSSPGRKGNGKLLLSLKLQGVSFIMKVQRQQQMCVASFSLFFFLCFVQLACCTE